MPMWVVRKNKYQNNINRLHQHLSKNRISRVDKALLSSNHSQNPHYLTINRNKFNCRHSSKLAFDDFSDYTGAYVCHLIASRPVRVR